MKAARARTARRAPLLPAGAEVLRMLKNNRFETDDSSARRLRPKGSGQD